MEINLHPGIISHKVDEVPQISNHGGRNLSVSLNPNCARRRKCPLNNATRRDLSPYYEEPFLRFDLFVAASAGSHRTGQNGSRLSAQTGRRSCPRILPVPG